MKPYALRHTHSPVWGAPRDSRSDDERSDWKWEILACGVCGSYEQLVHISVQSFRADCSAAVDISVSEITNRNPDKLCARNAWHM